MYFADKETRAEISRPRYGSPYPWPLNHILAFRKQFEVKNHLKAVGWYNKTLDQVYEDVHVGLQVNITERENRERSFLRLWQIGIKFRQLGFRFRSTSICTVSTRNL